MRPEARDELLRLNRAFYQSLAGAFADTRRRAQPGVRRVVERIPPQATVLDLGCGHGVAACLLAERGHRGRYLGIDSSESLLAIARARLEAPWVEFAHADLAAPNWMALPGGRSSRFDWVLCFSVLHHLPDARLRRRVVREIAQALAPDGSLAASVWDFQHSARLGRRVVAWEEIGLTAEDVDPGDALLDWRHAGHGLRYVHHFPSAELAGLAQAAGLKVVEEFRSDGEGGRLGLYQIWRR